MKDFILSIPDWDFMQLISDYDWRYILVNHFLSFEFNDKKIMLSYKFTNEKIKVKKAEEELYRSKKIETEEEYNDEICNLLKSSTKKQFISIFSYYDYKNYFVDYIEECEEEEKLIFYLKILKYGRRHGRKYKS